MSSIESLNKSSLAKVLTLSDIRQKAARDHNYFCPFTVNKKFETFVGQLLELGIGNSEKTAQIVEYVQTIETFYTDKIALFKKKSHDLVESHRKDKAKNMLTIDRNRELEDVLFDALNQTKANIAKRRMQAQRDRSQPRQSSRSPDTQNLDFDMTVAKLHLINGNTDLQSELFKRIRYEDLTARDKEALVEMFVCHPSTLQRIYKLMFPTTRRVPIDYPDLSLVAGARHQSTSSDLHQSEDLHNISITKETLFTDRHASMAKLQTLGKRDLEEFRTDRNRGGRSVMLDPIT